MNQSVLDFVHDTEAIDVPTEVIAMARRRLLDLIGVAAAGRTTVLSSLICDHAVDHFGPGRASAPILFDGRRVSVPGAALAAGMTIDAIDAHDGHRLTKGHTGVHQLAALLAFTWVGKPSTEDPVLAADSDQFLASLVVGYEFATRAGIALHESSPDYHTSGAWGAVGCAALGSRILGLNGKQSQHALGIAEYHGPRSQMMRVIDHPTMLKDGSGWGAMAGVSAAYLAAAGFTGAPAITVTDPSLADIWSDLGSHWIIGDQYDKPHPVCRWAQPAVEAALDLMRTHRLDGSDIESIKIHTFHEAARLATVLPADTEQAQYSLPFPVAAAIQRGRLGAAEISAEALGDPDIIALAKAVTVVEDEDHNRVFPGRRLARVSFVLGDGRRLTSGDHEPRGESDSPLSEDEIRVKYRELAEPALGRRRACAIETAIDSMEHESGSILPFLNLLVGPLEGGAQ